METWKVIEGYDNLYEVSDLGRVRSLGRDCNSKNNSINHKRERILIQEIKAYGYCRVRLFPKEGKPKHYAVHRLVAQAFLSDYDESKQINHKNEIKTDNRAINLEVCTPKYNCNYGTRNKRLSEKNTGKKVSEETKRKIAKAFARPINQYTKNGAFLISYESAKEASKRTGIDYTDILACKNGKRPSAGGYVWRDKAWEHHA